MVVSSIPTCRFCGAVASLGHDENLWTQRRHDAISRSIHRCLNQVNAAIVEIEPTTLTGQRRNDLRVRGTSFHAFTDYDFKVYSLGDRVARSTVGPTPPNYKLPDFCFDRYVGWPDKAGKIVEKRAPRVADGVLKPLILSIGGLMSHSTSDEWKVWREVMPEGVFLRLQRRMSVELVRARARTLVL